MVPRLLRSIALVILALSAGLPSLAKADEPPHGLVVLSAPSQGSSANAGLLPGDVLTSWHRETGGPLRWPSDLAAIESEQAPRGTVVLRGRRGEGEQIRSWTMPALPWGVRTRPALGGGPFQVFYEEGARLLALRNVKGAAESWMAGVWAMDRAGDKLAAAWLLGEIGRAWAQAGQWNEAGLAFERALVRAEKTGMAAHLLREWGAAALNAQRWDLAESCYRRALALAPAGSFAAARDLALVAVAETHQGNLDEAERLYRRALNDRVSLIPVGAPYLVQVVQEEIGRFARADQLTGANRERIEELRLKLRRLRETLLAEAGVPQQRVAQQVGAQEQKGARDSKAPRDGKPGKDTKAASTEKKPEAPAEPEKELSLLERVTQALAQAEQEDPGSLLVSDHWQDLGTLAFAEGDLVGAEVAWLRALDLREKLAPGTLREARTLHDLGRLHLRAKRTLPATSSLCRAAGLLDWLTPEELESATTRTALAARPAAYDRDCVAALVETGRPEEAFLALERSHARAAGSPLSTETAGRRKRIEEERDSDLARLAHLSTSRDRDEVHLVQSHARYLENQRAETAAPLSLPELRSALAPGTLLLAWSDGSTEDLLFVVRPDGMQGPGVEVFAVPNGTRKPREKIAALAQAEQFLLLLPEKAATPGVITTLTQGSPTPADRKPLEKTASVTAWTALRKQESQRAAAKQ
jgi:tetratricopeptide (TPR) repeat protein